MSFSAVVSLGMGAMIGAGIFALLGEAGAMAVLLYLAGLLSLSLVAKTFGNYGAALVPGSPGWLAPLLAVGVMVLFVPVSLRGSASVGRVELWIELFKFAVLLTLALGGLTVLRPRLLAPSTYPGASSIAASVAVAFFAYAGFRVITNAAENVEHPERIIPRAITTAILLVMALYIVIALVVFGTLSPDAVIAAKGHALAEAARPVFGSVGVAAVAVTALVATASAINASLFSVTNVAYQMAKNGELPGLFRRHVRNSREGLLVSGFVVAIAAVAFDLSQIAILGAISILLVHTAVHVGHLRLLGDTGANKWVVALAAAAAITIVVVTLVDAARKSWTMPLIFAALVAVSFGGEWALRLTTQRKLRVRVGH